jgi:amino acid adenylation domain-containing protein
MTDTLSSVDARQALLRQRLEKARARSSVNEDVIAARRDGAPAVLSSTQRRLWFLSQWEPDSAAYNIPIAFQLSGPLEPAALDAALRGVVERHAVLRTLYVGEEGQPRAVVQATPERQLRLATASHEEALAQLETEAHRPFVLDREWPLRATLWRTGAETHLLLITLHHIAADGWSIGVLLRELSMLYAGQALAPPPIQFFDYVDWTRTEARRRHADRSLGARQGRLTGAPGLLELPTDFPRPAVRAGRGADAPLAFSPDVSAAVRRLARETGTTLTMVLTAGLAALCQRYSGQDDIVLGAPAAGRERPELEGLIGCFVNTMALRLAPRPDLSVRAFLTQVREELLSGAEHQDAPFEQLVERLAPERRLDHSPIFQVMLTVNNVPRAALDLPGVTAIEQPMAAGGAKFDLSISIDDLDERLIIGVITYDAALFSHATLERMISHFGRLLAQMAAHPDALLGELSMLDAVDEVALAALRGPPAMARDGDDVVARFEAMVDRAPDAQAVVFEDERLTYGELEARANGLARALMARGIGPEARVGILLERGPGVVVAMLGVLKAGGAYVPIDPAYPPDRIRFMLADVEAGWLVTEPPLAQALGEDLPCGVTLLEAGAPDQDVPRPGIAPHPRRLMYLLFTSGSTGRPKAVAIEHGGYVNYLHGVLEHMALSPGARLGLATTFAADLGTTMIYGALCAGGTLHILARERAADPVAFADYVRDQALDVLKLVPSHLESLASMGGLAEVLPRRLLILAGEALPWALVEAARAARPNLRIQNHYGPTEISVAALVYPVADILPETRGRVVPLGQPLAGVRVHLLDAEGRRVPVGVPGELCVGGAGVARGYAGRPDLTAERFTPDPFGPPGARLYRTGDRARLTARGELEFLGRLDHQVKIRGYRIETGEIETLLTQDPAIREARVIAREDKVGDPRLAAYVVFARDVDAELVLAKARARLKAVLPDYMAPSAYVALDRLPLNANGKLDRHALPPPAASVASARGGEGRPRNETEERVAAVWREILDVPDLGVEDNFFDLGGDSFKAVRAVRALGAGVSVMDLFQNPTVEALANLLRAATAPVAQRRSILHRLTPAEPAPGAVSWVCAPFGGGGAISYLALAGQLPPDQALYAIDLPGHDYARPDEPLEPFDTVALRCADEIMARIDGPVLIYGHCLGAAMAVAIGQELERRGVELVGVMVGGAFPMPRLDGALFDALGKILPTDALMSTRSILDGLLLTGGAQGDEDEAELRFLVRNMRHDGREAEGFYTRVYRQARPCRLAAPLTCVVGEKDRATEFHAETVAEWGRFASSVALRVIPNAGHFFQKHQAAELAAIGAEQIAGRDGACLEQPVLVRPPMAADRRLSTFLVVTLGQIISMIGSGLSTFALGVWLYQRTHQVSQFSIMVAFGLVPGILLLPLAGAAADRWDRRKIMMASDGLALVATAGAAILAWRGALAVEAMYALAALGSTAAAFRQPAYVAAIAQMTPKHHLGRANGFTQLGSASGLILAQVFGGMLMAALGLRVVLTLDVLTYAVALATLSLVRFPNRLFKRREEPFAREVSQGWRYILARPGMTGLMVFFAAGNCLASIVNVLVTPMVTGSAGPAGLGWVLAMNGAGLLSGALVMSVWGGARRRAPAMIAFVALFGVSAIILGLRPGLTLPLLGMFGVGVCTAMINAHWLSLIQVKVGLELQGRVLAANQMLARCLMPLGALGAGFLVDHWLAPAFRHGLAARAAPLLGHGAGRSEAMLMVLAGAASLILGGLALAYRPLRRLDCDLPDAIPDPVILDKDALQERAAIA